MISEKSILKKRGYTILSKLGEGSYAKVYLAEFSSIVHNQSTALPTKLAVKVIETKHGPSDFIKKFLPRELNILSVINHPHIIHIHSILQIELKFYVFMRYAEQGDLLDFIIKNGLVNENQARVWTRQIAIALQYLHELNIAHRDMKCENILVTMNFNAKLSDFGFARYTVDIKRKPVLSETYCGSLSYASPEILRGRPYDAKISDIWSFGVIIYVMLNKSMPFDDVNPKLLYNSQMKRSFKFRSKLEQILSSEVKKLVYNILEPDPMKRYRIEGIINSKWIAMDKRLIVLDPLELNALTNAFENPLAPPESFKLPILKLAKQLPPTPLTIDIVKPDNASNTGTIKPYSVDPPRILESMKISKNMKN